MTPNFALDLSEDGIDLLHRDPAGTGWVRVQSVSLEGDVAAGLHGLREKAIEIEGAGFATKLILPPSQLLYATVETGRRPKVDVIRALEDRTPYKIDEINFAISGSGDSRQVVAVAKETLAEAEGFLAPYDLNPVGFTAMPKPGHFKGEPFLGAFAGGKGFKPDTAPITIVEAYAKPASKLPEPETPAALPVDLSSNPGEIAKDVSPEPDENAEPESTSQTELAANSAPEAKPEAKADPVAEEKPDAEEPKIDKSDDQAAPIVARKSEPAVKAEPVVDKPASLAAEKSAPPLRRPQNALDTGFSSTRSASSKVSDETESRLNRLSPRIATPQKAAEIAAKAKPKATRNRRLTHLISGTPKGDTGGATTPPTVGTKTRPTTRVTRPLAAARKTSAILANHPPSATNSPPSPPGLIGAAAALASRKDEPDSFTAPKRDTKPDPLEALAARDAEKREKSGFVKYAVAAVLLFGLVAAIGSMLLPERGGSNETPSIAASPEQDQAPVSVNETEFASVPLAGPQTEQEFPGTLGSEDFTNFTTTSANSAPLAAPVSTADSTPQDLPANDYSSTGIWDSGPDLSQGELGFEAPAQIDQFYVASLDASVNFEDPAALRIDPTAQIGVSPGISQSLPTPGQRFAFDDRGLVIATPEGAVTPAGAVVFSNPEVAPTPRPGSASLVEDADELVEETEQVATVDQAPSEDVAPVEQTSETTELVLVTPDLPARVAAIRPIGRPTGLGEAIERANLGGRSLSELAGIQPSPRPDEAIQAVQQIREQEQLAAEEAAQLQADTEAAALEAARADAIALAVLQAEQEAAESEELADLPTVRAVSSSVIPELRPDSIQQVAARIRTPDQTSAVAQSAPASTAAIRRNNGPAVTRSSRVAPTAPSPQTVARAATDSNALALGRLALVGVFGTESNRRALIRLPNGRFEKVTIGDRIDGGRIAAIGETRLQYVKGGRTVTLDMP